MTKQHKWHREIKAWADGAEIESRFKDKVTGWTEWDCMGEILAFLEDSHWEYRIKPQPKEPQYLYVYKVNAKIVELYDELQMGWDGKMLLGKIKLEVDE